MASKVDLRDDDEEDPVLAAFARAPIADPLSPEEEAICAERMADGTEPVSWETIAATIQRRRREADGG